jgi:hypothetical protein
MCICCGIVYARRSIVCRDALAEIRLGHGRVGIRQGSVVSWTCEGPTQLALCVVVLCSVHRTPNAEPTREADLVDRDIFARHTSVWRRTHRDRKAKRGYDAALVGRPVLTLCFALACVSSASIYRRYPRVRTDLVSLRILSFTPDSQRCRDSGVDSAWPGQVFPEWTGNVS